MLPEEQELERLETQQKELEEQVAAAELNFESASVEVERFTQRYYRAVGSLYAELDRLDAEMAFARAKREPNDEKLRKEAEAFGQRARKSAAEAGLATEQSKTLPEITSELKAAYRRAVKLMHPDLAVTEGERLRRTALTVRVNLAFKSGDLSAVEAIIREFGEDPEAIVGEDVGAKIVKTIRRIAQLRRRLSEIQQNLEALKRSDAYQLKKAIEGQEQKGDDPLGNLAVKLNSQIKEKRSRFSCATNEL